MATNRVIAQASRRSQLIAVTAGLLSGAPFVFGKMPGVLLKDADASNKAVLQLDGIFSLSVKGIDGSGNLGIAVGDIIYYTAGDTPKLSVKATGVRFGYALEVVVSGATTTIKVQVGY